MECSRRDLFNDMAEHRSILKKIVLPLFYFYTQNRLELPVAGVSFFSRPKLFFHNESKAHNIVEYSVF